MDPPFVFPWNGGCPVLGEDSRRHPWGICQGFPNGSWQGQHPFNPTNFPSAPPFAFQNWCSFPRNPLFRHPATPQQETPWCFGAPHDGLPLERRAWQPPKPSTQPSQLRPWHQREHLSTEAPAAISIQLPGLDAINPSQPFSVQSTTNEVSEQSPTHLFLKASTRPLPVMNKTPTEALSLASSSTVTRSSNQTTKNRPPHAVDAPKPPKKLQAPKPPGHKRKMTPDLDELQSAEGFSEPASSPIIPVHEVTSETEVSSLQFKNSVMHRQEGKPNAMKKKIPPFLKTSEINIGSSGTPMTRRVSTFSADCNTWKAMDTNNAVSQNNLSQKINSKSPSAEPSECVVSILPTLPEPAVPHWSPANLKPRLLESLSNSGVAQRSQDTNTASVAVIESVHPSVSPRAARSCEDPLPDSCNASTCSWNTHTNSVSAPTSIEPVPTLSRIDVSSMVSKWLDTSVLEPARITSNDPRSEIVPPINFDEPDFEHHEGDDVVFLQNIPLGSLKNELAASHVKHDNSANVQRVSYPNLAVEGILLELNTYTACCILDFCEDSNAKKDVLKLYTDSKVSSSKREYEEQIRRIVSSAVERKRGLWKGLTGILRRLNKMKWSLPLAPSGSPPLGLHIEQIQHALLRDVAEFKFP
ncbi:hypothetical protein ISCGN_013330 [Ixodes scapularis]